MERLYQFAINRLGILPERLANPEELQHIQPSLPMLNPPDEGLLAFK